MIREHHTAGLYVSHDLAVVAQIADRIIVLRNGVVVEEGETSEILSNPRTEYARALVATRRREKPIADQTKQAAPLVLELKKVSASYAKAVRVVEDIELQVRRGETVAVVGESGSGKSTLARVITGLLPREAGEINFDGVRLPSTLEARDAGFLRRIQLIYQMPDVALNPRQKVGEIIGRPLTFYLGLTGAKLRDRTAELLREIDLSPDFADRYPLSCQEGRSSAYVSLEPWLLNQSLSFAMRLHPLSIRWLRMTSWICLHACNVRRGIPISSLRMISVPSSAYPIELS